LSGSIRKSPGTLRTIRGLFVGTSGKPLKLLLLAAVIDYAANEVRAILWHRGGGSHSYIRIGERNGADGGKSLVSFPTGLRHLSAFGKRRVRISSVFGVF